MLHCPIKTRENSLHFCVIPEMFSIIDNTITRVPLEVSILIQSTLFKPPFLVLIKEKSNVNQVN